MYEYKNYFKIQIYTETTNAVSNHSVQHIPVSVFENDEKMLEEFKAFLKEKVGEDYIVKIDKEKKVKS